MHGTCQGTGSCLLPSPLHTLFLTQSNNCTGLPHCWPPLPHGQGARHCPCPAHLHRPCNTTPSCPNSTTAQDCPIAGRRSLLAKAPATAPAPLDTVSAPTLEVPHTLVSPDGHIFTPRTLSNPHTATINRRKLMGGVFPEGSDSGDIIISDYT